LTVIWYFFNIGFPILEDGKWYSLWGMRPSRDVVSFALGLKRRGLEKQPTQTINCVNGDKITKEWTVHHVYECGLMKSPAATSQFGCPYAQFNSPWKSHNNRQRKKPPEAGFATGGVIGVIY
jgi:hypothetical protein